MSAEQSLSAIKKCRLCLRKNETYINLFEGNFRQMILDLTSLEISEEDGYPHLACINCVTEVLQATKTRKRIIECYEKLKGMITDESVLKDNGYRRQITITDNCSRQELIDGEINCNEGVDKNFTDDEYSEPSILNSFVLSNAEAVKSNDSVEEVHDPLKIENDVHIIEIDEVFETESCRKSNDLIFSESDESYPIEESNANKQVKTEENNYICDECGEAFNNDKYAFRLHKAKHKKSQCKICGISIRTDNMKKHVDMHACEPSICELCGSICKNFESLRSHIFYMHQSSADKFTCDQCPKSFRRKCKLAQHVNKEHTGVRRHSCPICQKKFFSSYDIKCHINTTHKKLRPHICSYCRKGFSSKHALKTHIRQHTNETPYKCSVCAEGFRQKVSLRSHLKSKHNIEEDKKFPCEFCEKLFISDFALKVHLRLHNDHYYKCDECNEYFQQSIYLINHRKTVHSEDESMIDLKKFETIDHYKKSELLDRTER